MPAETRPIAASFSCRIRACKVRTSSSSNTAKGCSAAACGLGDGLSRPRERMKRTRSRNVRLAPSPKTRVTSRPASGHSPSANARSAACCSAVHAGGRCKVKGAGGLRPWSTSRARAAGLAARTRRLRSTTSTPSAISSMTRRLSCACWRASSRLPRAASSSRASRPANSPASRVIMNMPSPARPDCSISAGTSAPTAARQVAASRIKATPAAVPSAIRRPVSTPAIKTGSTSKAA